MEVVQMTDPHSQPYTIVHGPDAAGRSSWAGPDRSWTPPPDLVSQDPADHPFETGEKPSFGDVPCNIIYRADDSDDWDGPDGFEDGSDPSDLDGNTKPQDADYDNITGDFDDDDLDSGPVAENEVCCDRGFSGGPGPRVTPGPTVVLPTRGRPVR
jgi:hypothetical protein